MLQRAKYPKKAKVLVVFDMPTKEEVKRGEAFTGASNLNMLTSLRTGRASVFNKMPVPGWVGITAKDIEVTYVDYTNFGDFNHVGNFDYREEISKKPKDGYVEFRKYFISSRLHRELLLFQEYLEAVDPTIVVITGKWGLFFLTDEVSLTNTADGKERKPLGALQKYRGSMLIKEDRIFFPIYHTLIAVTMPEHIPIIEMDLQKLGDVFAEVQNTGSIDSYRLNHTYHLGHDAYLYAERLLARLDSGEKLELSIDLETMLYKTPGSSIIDCIGIAHSVSEGCCIAFAKPGVASLHNIGYETELMSLLFQLLTHPNAEIIGQNIVSFDIMVILGRFLFIPSVKHDTMIMQHTLYSFLPKDLSFLASMYCKAYSYWKGEIVGETRQIYNIKDAIYTYEVCQELKKQFVSEDKVLTELYNHTMYELVPATIRTMRRGVRVDIERKNELYNQFSLLAEQVRTKLYDTIGFTYNLNSTPQKKKIFEDFLGIKLKVKKRKGKEDTTTTDSAAMLDYMEEYPMLRPFLALMLEYTAITKFTNTFLGALLDPDCRMRTQYKVAGTVTGRLASSKNAFGRAANMQNIPKKGKLELVYATELGEDLDSDYLVYSAEGSLQLPNIKKMFIPDEGMELMDADLSGADARVVAWESNCKFLMDFFTRNEGKLYAYIASEHLQREITSKSPEYGVYKAICHGSNYNMGVQKLAIMLGMPLRDAERLKQWYFTRCPEIPAWHQKIQSTIATKGYISNIFGRRAYFIDKTDPTRYNKAYGFIGQSTVADAMNRAWPKVDTIPDVQVLKQVHDSLVTQYPIDLAEELRPRIIEKMEIKIPYKRELVIPVDFKCSRVSYGDV